MTPEDRKKLREARFGQNALSSDDALVAIQAAKRKFEVRAERFGIETQDSKDRKIKARLERFGIETEETIDAKKLERMKRFGLPVSKEALGHKKQQGSSTTSAEVDPAKA